MKITACDSRLANSALKKFVRAATHFKISGSEISVWDQYSCSECGHPMILPNWPVTVVCTGVKWDTGELMEGEIPSRELTPSDICNICESRGVE